MLKKMNGSVLVFKNYRSTDFWKVNVKVLSFFLLKKSISTPGWMDTVYKYIER